VKYNAVKIVYIIIIIIRGYISQKKINIEDTIENDNYFYI